MPVDNLLQFELQMNTEKYLMYTNVCFHTFCFNFLKQHTIICLLNLGPRAFIWSEKTRKTFFLMLEIPFPCFLWLVIKFNILVHVAILHVKHYTNYWHIIIISVYFPVFYENLWLNVHGQYILSFPITCLSNNFSDYLDFLDGTDSYVDDMDQDSEIMSRPRSPGSRMSTPELQLSSTHPQEVTSLVDFAAKIVAKHVSCEEIESHDPPLDESMLKKVYYFSFLLGIGRTVLYLPFNLHLKESGMIQQNWQIMHVMWNDLVKLPYYMIN